MDYNGKFGRVKPDQQFTWLYYKGDRVVIPFWETCGVTFGNYNYTWIGPQLFGEHYSWILRHREITITKAYLTNKVFVMIKYKKALSQTGSLGCHTIRQPHTRTHRHTHIYELHVMDGPQEPFSMQTDIVMPVYPLLLFYYFILFWNPFQISFRSWGSLSWSYV